MKEIKDATGQVFLPLQENAKRVAEILKVLAHETRLQVICCIGTGERTVLDMANVLNVGQSCLSQHLGKMRTIGILSVRREGNQSFYSVTDPKMLDLVKAIKQNLC